MRESWLAKRTQTFDASGIRRVFELGARLENPVNFSIGQPDFDVPQPVRRAAIEAIESGKNRYALSQGMPVLREKLLEKIRQLYADGDRDLIVTCGTSGGLVLAMMALVEPGDEVILFDPGFVMYPVLVRLFGGVEVYVDTYPNFRIDVGRVEAALTPKTKLILFNSPANPTGMVAQAEEVQAIAELAFRHHVALISDEIYSAFSYDFPFVSPARFNPDTIVVDGFSKSHGMPGWRLGFAHGPRTIIQEMIKLQQYSFVCAPQPFQWAGAVALDVPVDEHIDQYRRKRDKIVAGLRDHYELVPPSGAFYAFPKVPFGTATEFVERAIQEFELLMIPGSVFSQCDTHFRISYAVDDATIDRGIEILQHLARMKT